jgi:hypothetical protein
MSKARWDKIGSAGSGQFRAKVAAAWLAADVGHTFGVGLNTSGQVVKGAGNTGVIGVVVINEPKAIGDVVDVVNNGELADLTTLNDDTTALTAGTAYYADVTTGAITATATANKKIGFSIDPAGQGRFIVRCSAINTLAT